MKLAVVINTNYITALFLWMVMKDCVIHFKQTKCKNVLLTVVIAISKVLGFLVNLEINKKTN